MGFGATLTSESAVATPFRGVEFKPIAGVEDLLPTVGVWLPGNDNPALRRFVSLAKAMKNARASGRSSQLIRTTLKDFAVDALSQTRGLLP
jgi:hypothetical protein